MPKVTVVVAVRNGEQHLGTALSSICAQTLPDLEIIVVDDGSTDATAQIIEEFRRRDDRIQTVPGPATGSAGAARNVGLALATGEYLAFLDADDHFSPELLGRLVDRADLDAADVVATGFRVFDERGGEPVPVEWGLRLAHLPVRRPFPPQALGSALFYAFGPVAWNKLFRTSFVQQHGLRFQEVSRANDLLFTFSALALAERISYIDRKLIDYRIGNSGSLQGSRHRRPLEFAEALAALQEFLVDSGRFDTFEAAFVSEAVEVCLTNLDRAPTFEAFEQIDQALRNDLLSRFGALDRPGAYFVTRGLSERLAKFLRSTPTEYLFDRAQQLDQSAAKARTELRAALHEVVRQPVNPRPTAAVSSPVPPTHPAPGPVDVSVIIPVYNTSAWLADCLAGVNRQTRLNLEVICVDDGSTDSSPDILRAAAAADPRIQIITQENAGLSAARNRGIEVASGRYLCFLDSDDYWGPDALADLVQEADRVQADILFFDAETKPDAGVDAATLRTYHEGFYRRSHDVAEVSGGPELMALLKRGGDYRVQACLYLLRRDYLQDRGLSFVPGLPREDNLFTFEALLRADRAGHRAVPLYVRRLRPGSLITAGSRVSAAKGYYVSFYEMLRLTSTMSFSPEVGPEVGATAFKAFKAAAQNFTRLDPEVGDQFAKIDTQPDAQAIFLILKRMRDEARRAKRQQVAKAPRPASAAAPPAKVSGLRRQAGRGLRYLQRLLRRR